MRKLSQAPDWVIGLVLAVVLALILYNALGIGDDPTVGIVAF